MKPAIITAALTGPIATKADNPNLPVTPEEIALEAKRAYEAGAAVVHLHLRDEHGKPTGDLETGRRVIDLVSEQCPVHVQLSTGVGLEVEFEDRARLIELRPAMATLNVASMTFGQGEFRNPPEKVRRLAARMIELGVKPELELYDSGHLEIALNLQEEGLIEPPMHVSMVMGVRNGGMASTPENLLRTVRELPDGAVWQVIAIGRLNLEMTAIGLALGGNARTGMEDTLLMEKGHPVESNEQLVSRLTAVATALGRTPATVDEVAEGLQSK